MGKGPKIVAPDLYKRMNRRGNISEYQVVFQEKNPLALRNFVKSTAQGGGQKVCMTEMMDFMDCMTKFGQDKTMCSKELAS